MLRSLRLPRPVQIIASSATLTLAVAVCVGAQPGSESERRLPAPPPAPEVAAALARADVQRAITFVSARRAQMANGLVALAAIESPSGQEQRRAEAVAERMRNIGLADVRVGELFNVTGRIPGRSGKSVVFVSTLDDLGNIPALQRAFGKPPHVVGDRVVGPGTNTSSTTEAMLAAAEALLSIKFVPEHDILFAAVAQEETGLRGMKALVGTLGSRALAYIDILGDGSSVTYGALGIHWYRVIARGPAGHSLAGGLPNVNQGIARAVDRIFAIPQPDMRDNPRRTILNIAMLQSGAVFNHKPDSGWFSVDIRSLDAATIARNEAAVREVLVITARETGISLALEPVQQTPGGQIAGADTTRLVRASAAIARHLALSPRFSIAGSANLNVPLGQGTLAIGIGGERGGARGELGEFADIPAMLRTAHHVLLLAVVVGSK